MRTKALIFLTFAFMEAGCLHPKIGPQSLTRDRSRYSVSLADSWKALTLLNIVKVRYLDPPVYVDIGSVVSSYTLSQNAMVGGNLTGNGNTMNLGGAVTFSNSPTITYPPLTGNAYINGLTTSLPVAQVFGAIQNGVPADSILLSSLQSINGLRNQQAGADGIRPADPEFHRVRELMRNIQLSGAVRLYVKENAAKNEATVLALPNKNIPPDIQAASAELRRLLRLRPDATEFTLVSAPLPSSDTEVAILTRSILGILQNMAAEVEVPHEHSARHFAVPGFETGRTIAGVVPIIRIHSAKNKSADAFVDIYYRDTWFWIDDSDLVSKRVFAQLMQLFTMTDTGPKQNLPVVTIPSR
jgi:hypothetical protein